MVLVGSTAMTPCPPCLCRGDPMWSPAVRCCHVPRTRPPPHRQTPRAEPRPPGRPHVVAPTTRQWVAAFADCLHYRGPSVGFGLLLQNGGVHSPMVARTPDRLRFRRLALALLGW